MKRCYFPSLSIMLLAMMAAILLSCTGLQQWRSVQQEQCAKDAWSVSCVAAQGHGSTGVLGTVGYIASLCMDSLEEMGKHRKTREAQLAALKKQCDEDGFFSTACTEYHNCAQGSSLTCASTLVPPENVMGAAAGSLSENKDCVQINDPCPQTFSRSPDGRHHFYPKNPPTFMYGASREGSCWSVEFVDCEHCHTTLGGPKKMLSFDELGRLRDASAGQPSWDPNASSPEEMLNSAVRRALEIAARNKLAPCHNQNFPN